MSLGAHTRGGPGGRIYVYRNVCDQRAGVNWSRPSEEKPAGEVMSNLPLVIHGREFLGVESWYFYHNLFIAPNKGGSLAFGYILSRTSPTTSRWLMNNILVYLNDYPKRSRRTAPLESDIALDGNVHWSPAPEAKVPDGFLEQIRAQERGDYSKGYPHAWGTHSQVGDPGFARFDASEAAANDYRLRPGSSAVGAGVVLPESLPDNAGRTGDGRPDIGPAPLGTDSLPVGRFGRFDAFQPPPAR
jgi:hypothetical protein